MPPEGNLLSTLHHAAANRLDADFLRPPGVPPISYRAMFERAARLATVLHGRGVAPGDRVVSCVAKSPDAVALYLACLHAGAVHVPLNPTFTSDELAYYVGDAEPALVVLDEDLDDLVARAGAADSAALVPRAPDDLAALLYTSGTTGQPKGAALTHANLWHNAWALHDGWRFTADDRLLHTLPLFHVHGLFVALHCAMLSAIPVTFLDRFDTDQVIEALPETTVLMGVPTHYHRLLDDARFDHGRVQGVRLFTCGSAPLPDAVFSAFEDRTGHRICERYGMSEAGIMTSNPYDGERVAGTVGFPLRDVELRVDARTAIVEVRGPHLFQGYWRRPDATAEAFTPDGWFISGDVGSLDSDGRLSLQGRAGDMIISGGENIYPKEIELVLDQVAGIRESAVIGAPHVDLGEGVVAVLVVDPSFDPADAAAALQQRLARFKHPKVQIVVEALPRNAMGKIQKNRLRADYADVFSAD